MLASTTEFHVREDAASPLAPCSPLQAATQDAASVIVVGAGPAGMKVARELRRQAPERSILIFGDERWKPYNRVLLTPLFAGETSFASIYFPWAADTESPGIRLMHRRIVAIDVAGRTVTDAAGESHAYGKLVLATGSRPHIPAPLALDHRHIFTFRDIDDAERLLAHWPRCRRALVVGGGLLGLEAARGLHRRGVDTTVVEHARWLMPQQIDAEAGRMLAERLTAIGLTVITGAGVRDVVAGDIIEGVRLTDGREIPCDTIVICAGIRPNMEIARDAGIRVGRGIQVNDNMQTSAPDVYAVGECAEHRERVYGLVAPGLEQAGVAAHHIARGAARYEGSLAATKLKVVGVPVFSMGSPAETEESPDSRSLVHAEPESGVYRRLVRVRGRLTAAVAIGDWPEINRLQEAVTHRRRITPWQARRFVRTGQIWGDGEAGAVASWPETATICNCTGVTRGAISEAIAAGAGTVEAIQAATNASTVCGTCRPLVAELVGQPATPAKTAFRRPLLILSAAALGIALLILFAVPPDYRTSVQPAFQLDLLWTDGLYKQISGFTLLTLGLLAILLSLRKRVRWMAFGSYGAWRLVHVALGAVLVAALVVHTGFHLGENLNRYLMMSFLTVALMGAASGGIVALEAKLGHAGGARARRISLWLHIIACWPLPALLGFHILSVYYF
jgi:nitrite reductase (NADH) large subunit